MPECFQYIGVIEQIYPLTEESADGHVHAVGVIHQFLFVGLSFFRGSVVNSQTERNKNKSTTMACKCFGLFKLTFNFSSLLPQTPVVCNNFVMISSSSKVILLTLSRRPSFWPRKAMRVIPAYLEFQTWTRRK